MQGHFNFLFSLVKVRTAEFECSSVFVWMGIFSKTLLVWTRISFHTDKKKRVSKRSGYVWTGPKKMSLAMSIDIHCTIIAMGLKILDNRLKTDVLKLSREMKRPLRILLVLQIFRSGKIFLAHPALFVSFLKLNVKIFLVSTGRISRIYIIKQFEAIRFADNSKCQIKQKNSTWLKQWTVPLIS